MPFIPHGEEEIAEMLTAAGLPSTDALFDEMPANLLDPPLELPDSLTEMAALRAMEGAGARNAPLLCFAGAGAYEHHIPAIVWEIAARGEFYSAYTPYQAEASQGTLQVLYEYQSFMTRLTAMDVSNASLYDGASALAEAVLMALRLREGKRRVLVPGNMDPRWVATLRTLVGPQGVELLELPYCTVAGTILPESLARFRDAGAAAVVVPQLNFFGVIEAVDGLTDWAHEGEMAVIAVVNPVALAVLKPPGRWGAKGADIAVGEGQPLGIPLSGGGPCFGFLTCRREAVRQLPGRLVARTVDGEGRTGYCLTLQAREQHIRRAKATSNICTNQGLMVTAATIHMAALGAGGLTETARHCHANARRLRGLLTAIPGVEPLFDGPFFHEFAIRLPVPAAWVLDRLLERGILGGYDLGRFHPDHADGLLVCATETRTEEDLQVYGRALAEILEARHG